MKKRDVIVKIESAKNAKQAKSVLKALGEPIWPNFNSLTDGFLTFNDQEKWTIIDRSRGNWASHLDKKNQISLRDLITILVAEVVDDKKSILSGKVAIQVNNEREFKLLMEYYEAKGWKSMSGTSYTYGKDVFIEDRKAGNLITYGNKFGFPWLGADYEWLKPENYTIIPFPDFASEVGIEVPVFVMLSEDGVDLYEGDKYFRAGRSGPYASGDYIIYETESLKKHHFVCCYPDSDKAFSTKEAAEAWIKEQNKPKEITIQVEHDQQIIVRGNGFEHKENGKYIYQLSGRLLERVYEAYKFLQP